jgi:uncharacterized protein with HEPN domain
MGIGCLPSKRASRRLQDLLDNIDSIERYTSGMNEKTFVANDLVADAVERCLSRISEAARKLGRPAETLVPDQPWGKIRGLGNLLRHEYDTIRRSVLWEIVTDDLPSLNAACTKAIATFDSEI